MHLKLNQSQHEQFNLDGFVTIESVLNHSEINTLRECFEPLFRGEFETGIQPDEWNWRAGVSDPSLTRQICNAWKSDRRVAQIVLHPDIGQACAQLHGWPGARINQDNVIWKPPGSRSLGFHQDASYQSWIVPAEMMTCWITLDDTSVEQGTILYIRGSHRWPLSAPISQFHAPDDPMADLKIAAAEAGISDLDAVTVPIEVPAGSMLLHHGRTWHGSGANTGEGHRRSIVSHCCSSEARFHEVNESPIYSRYRRRDTLVVDESFFPVIWREDGYRSAWLAEYF